MRVGVIQSCYFPWRGYFDFIRSVDLFVIYDDTQYSRGSWRNRNKLKMPNGTKWFTVPVIHETLEQRIEEVRINDLIPWREKHLNQLEENYRRAPYYFDAKELMRSVLMEKYELLSGLNVASLAKVCEYFGIRTPICRSSDFAARGSGTERLIALLRELKATTYLSGPAAREYIHERLFFDAGIELEYKTYQYAPYPQLWGAFDGAVSVLDLIANCGPKSVGFINSLQANDRVTFE